MSPNHPPLQAPALPYAGAAPPPRPPFDHLHVMPLHIKSAADQAFEGWASTPAVDRQGEVVGPEALAAALQDYMRNPIVTYAHDWLNPIGRTVEARASEAGLRVRMQLGRTARAREVWQLIEDRILRSLSVGFNAGPEDGYERDGVWHWTRIELLEIAVVPIPANPQAVITMARQLGLDTTPPVVLRAKARQAAAEEVARRVREVVEAAEAETQAAPEVGERWQPPPAQAGETVPHGEDQEADDPPAPEVLLAAIVRHLDPETVARLSAALGPGRSV